MASGTKLELSFVAGDGGTVRYTFNYAKPNATKANVVSLAEYMITNKSYFNSTPTELKGAKTITTTENVYDLSTLATEFPHFANKIRLPEDNTAKVVEVDSDVPEMKAPESAQSVTRLR